MVGSLAWLIDRTNEEILGSLWLADNTAAVTAAHVILPYITIQEALQVTFPATGYSCGVRTVEFHTDFDRWMAKRLMGQASVLPSFELMNQRENLVTLKLTSKLQKLDTQALSRIESTLSMPPPQEETIVSGNANRLELTSMVQTLVNARNYGTLVLTDKRHRPVARMFLEDGKLTHAQYRNSINEQAMYRLITSQNENFLFHFLPQVSAQWNNFAPIQKGTAFLLMEAYRRMEEQAQLATELNASFVAAIRIKQELDLSLIPEDFHYPVNYVFPLIDPEIPVSCLSRSLSFDSYVVLQSLKHLIETGHVTLEPRDPAESASSLPLVMADDPVLKQGDEIFALGIDPESRQAVISRGNIVFEDWQGYPRHYLHTVSLPPEFAGAPLVKDGVVVGTNCGLVPQLIEGAPGPFEPQLMVSTASVYVCLGLLPATTSTTDIEPITADDIQKQAALMAAGTGEHLKPMVTTGQHPQLDSQSSDRNQAVVPPSEAPPPVSKLSSFFTSIRGVVDGFKKAPPPVTSNVFQASLLRRGLDSDRFVKVPADTPFMSGDLVKLEIVMAEEGHIYVIHKPSQGNQLKIVFPYNRLEDKPITKGSVLTIPERAGSSTGQTTTGKFFLPGIPIPSQSGEDIVYLICSSKPLADVIFEENNLEGTFENLQKLIDDKPGTQTGEFPAISLTPESLRQEMAETNSSVIVSKFKLSHLR